jgi:arylsulfatase
MAPGAKHAVFAALAVTLLAAAAAYLSGPGGKSLSEPSGKADVPASASGGVYACRGCNIVLITVETTRADHLGCYGYGRNTTPFIDSLAAGGLVFEDAYAVRGNTWPSLTAMLTSRYPASTGVRGAGELLGAPAPTVASVLGENGYATAAFLTNFCDAGAYGFNASICRFSEAGGNDRNATDDALGWMKSMGRGRFFAWIHYFSPHNPYYPPSGYDVFTDGGYGGPYNGSVEQLYDVALGKANMSGADVAHVIALYDGDLLAADGEVRRVYSFLQDSGLLDSTIFIVSSDHGEELYDRNRYFFHDCSFYGSVLHVPLIMRLPGGPEGVRRGGFVGSVDYAPTLLALVNLSGDPSFEGSAYNPLLPDGGGFDAVIGERYVAAPKDAKGRHQRLDPEGAILTIRTGRWRYVYNPMNTTPRNQCWPAGLDYPVAHEELYDIGKDQHELTNVAADNPGVARELRDELLRRYPQEGGAAPRQASKDALDELRSLGYAT